VETGALLGNGAYRAAAWIGEATLTGVAFFFVQSGKAGFSEMSQAAIKIRC